MRLIAWLACLLLLSIGPTRADALLDSLLPPSQSTPQFLPVEQAFALSWQQEGEQVPSISPPATTSIATSSAGRPRGPR